MGSVAFFFSYFGSPKFTDVGYRPDQPVDYSHKLHAGELGMDCRYCHTSVENSQEAIIYKLHLVGLGLYMRLTLNKTNTATGG